MKKNKVKETLFWHDYETFGIDPQLSNVAQFAGIRTDLDLNILEEKIDIICRPTLDRLPSPEACMVTGISPMTNKIKGMNEVSFFQRINKELGRDGTCGIGYNNISFDDEVTRNGLYRNFIDPYQREWKNGCSRWDLLNVLRIVDAIKPNTFIVPTDKETGKKVFKLDQLSLANGIEHENAHDALADVIATIEMAKIVKEKEPELFDLLFKQRNKAGIEGRLFEPKSGWGAENKIIFKPFVMADSFFGGDQKFIEVLYPISTKGTDLYCIKLTKEIDQILNLDSDDLKEALYKKKEDMQEGELRIPLHTLRTNKCPIILPVSMITKEIAENLGIDGNQLRTNIGKIKANFSEIQQKIVKVFGTPFKADDDLDVDQQIYNGFFSNNDKSRFEEIKKTESIYLLDYLKENKSKFEDKRIEEMLFRYICRNFETDLDDETLQKWDEFCKNRILDGVYSLTFDQYFEKLEILKEEHKENESKLKLLKDLTLFGEKTKAKLIKK